MYLTELVAQTFVDVTISQDLSLNGNLLTTIAVNAFDNVKVGDDV